METFIFKPELRAKYKVTSITDVIYLNYLKNKDADNASKLNLGGVKLSTSALHACKMRLLDKQLVRRTSKGYALTEEGVKMVTLDTYRPSPIDPEDLELPYC